MLDWLPEIVAVNPWTDTTYEKLYEIFCRDIRDHDLRYLDCEVWCFKDKEDGKEGIFWHLTSREFKPKSIPRRKRKFFPPDQECSQPERLPDPRRCERLSWVRPMIENPAKPDVLAWDYEEGDRTIKTYIWLKEEGFVVIMKKYPTGKRRLITSFYVDVEYKRGDFKRKYASRIK